MLKLVRRKLGNEILCENISSGLSVISMNRPRFKNALGEGFIQELNEALDQVEQDTTVRCAVIRSSVPGAFCAGADLYERRQMNAEEILAWGRNIRYTFTKIEQLRVPTIAAIDGYAMGGGIELAMACDLRVSSPQSTIAFPETALAIFPGAGGAHRLLNQIPITMAKELIYTAKRYTAEQLAPYGLINRLSDDPYTTAIEYATLISQNDSLAVAVAKREMNMSFQQQSNYADEISSLSYARILYAAESEKELK